MATLATILSVLALVAALLVVVAFRIFASLCIEVRDALRTLHVLVNGLEASMKPTVEQARDSADAACAQLDELSKRLDSAGPAQQPLPPPAGSSQTSFRRVETAREMLAQLEAQSFEEASARPAGVRRG